MPMGRPAKELTLSAEQRAQLESIARSHSLPAALVRRAQMIIRMADGEPNSVVAEQFGLSRPTVTFWRTRFRERGVEGVSEFLCVRHTMMTRSQYAEQTKGGRAGRRSA